MKIVVGCCGIPVALSRYAAALSAVEVQQTFYQPPGPPVLRRWREGVPSGFRFALKAWQLVTHPPSSPTYRRLRTPLTGPPEAYGWFRPTPQVAQAWEATLDAARLLAAEVIVLQCPASFRPEPAHIEWLRSFASSVQRDGFVLAWEPRGAWPAQLVAALCGELALSHAVDPLAGPWLGGEVAYFRLHGRGGFRYRYTDADLADLEARCRAALDAGAREVWVCFNTVSMFQDALRFQDRLREG
jgi:uncharacterized protein YecE (DUF72 family)